MKKIVHTSDTHMNHIMLNVPEGDILLHTGDFTTWGSFQDIKDFSFWLGSQDFKYKIVIAGNHDVKFETYPEMCMAALKSQCKDVIYLNEQSITIEGLKIYGSPYTPRFAGGFQLDLPVKEEYEYWKKRIPEDTDILMTHGPPYKILDKVERPHEIEYCGSEGLLQRIKELDFLRLHCFGHIHEGYGRLFRHGMQFSNGSAMNWRFVGLNKPNVIEL